MLIRQQQIHIIYKISISKSGTKFENIACFKCVGPRDKKSMFACLTCLFD